MPDTDLIQRLRQRKIAQWAVAYLAGAWLLLQVVSVLAEPFDWPALVLRGAAVVLAVGLLAALVVAWYHGEKGAQRVSGVELLMLAGILVLAGAAVTFVGSGRRQQAANASALRSAGPSPGATPTNVTAPAEQASIAVLPFLDMSPGHDQEYFSDGLTEELLATLSKLPELRVAARTSAFVFKGHDVAIDSIGRALRVANVLEGSVRKAGDRVRITAQLIDATSGYHRWSESYDRELKDVFAVQNEIARAIVDQLKVRLAPTRTGAPLARDETADPEAHALVLRAMAALAQATPAGVAQAIALARDALRRDARYARAHEVLASALFGAGWLRFAPFEQSYREARAEATRALALDPSLAGAHVVLGRLAAWIDWNWLEAERQLSQALERNPRLPEAHGELAILLNHLGRRQEMVAEARRAVELDPLSARVHGYAGNEMGDTLPEEGVRELETALALSPGTPVHMCNLAWQYSYVGRHADALRLARAARALLPRDEFAAYVLGLAAARAGQRAEAERVLRELDAWPASPYLRASVHASLGGKEQAFRLLERAVAVRDDWAPELNVDPMLDPLRDDPRMAHLIREIGLPVLRGTRGQITD